MYGANAVVQLGEGGTEGIWKGGNAKTAMATAGFCDNGLQYLSKSVPDHPP